MDGWSDRVCPPPPPPQHIAGISLWHPVAALLSAMQSLHSHVLHQAAVWKRSLHVVRHMGTIQRDSISKLYRRLSSPKCAVEFVSTPAFGIQLAQATKLHCWHATCAPTTARSPRLLAPCHSAACTPSIANTLSMTTPQKHKNKFLPEQPLWTPLIRDGSRRRIRVERSFGRGEPSSLASFQIRHHLNNLDTSASRNYTAMHVPP